MSNPTETVTTSENPFYRYKYHLLVGGYITLTSLFFYRVHRQPFTPAIKSEQYETIFKGTTLAAFIGGVAMSSAGRAKYRRYREGGMGGYPSTVQYKEAGVTDSKR